MLTWLWPGDKKGYFNILLCILLLFYCYSSLHEIYMYITDTLLLIYVKSFNSMLSCISQNSKSFHPYKTLAVPLTKWHRYYLAVTGWQKIIQWVPTGLYKLPFNTQLLNYQKWRRFILAGNEKKTNSHKFVSRRCFYCCDELEYAEENTSGSTRWQSVRQ